MDAAMICNAIGGLEDLVRTAKGALWQVERELFGDPGYGDDDLGSYEYPRWGYGRLPRASARQPSGRHRSLRVCHRLGQI
jgi:hypothetical protein